MLADRESVIDPQRDLVISTHMIATQHLSLSRERVAL